MTAVLLVFQLGQPRIFFSMSRDGLLPPVVRAASTRVPHAARHHDRHRHRRGGARLRRSSTTTRPTTSRTSARCSRSSWSASACSPCASRTPTARGRSACPALVVPVAPLGALACIYVMTGLPTRPGSASGLDGGGGGDLLLRTASAQPAGARANRALGQGDCGSAAARARAPPAARSSARQVGAAASRARRRGPPASRPSARPCAASIARTRASSARASAGDRAAKRPRPPRQRAGLGRGRGRAARAAPRSACSSTSAPVVRRERRRPPATRLPVRRARALVRARRPPFGPRRLRVRGGLDLGVLRASTLGSGAGGAVLEACSGGAARRAARRGRRRGCRGGGAAERARPWRAASRRQRAASAVFVCFVASTFSRRRCRRSVPRLETRRALRAWPEAGAARRCASVRGLSERRRRRARRGGQRGRGGPLRHGLRRRRRPGAALDCRTTRRHDHGHHRRRGRDRPATPAGAIARAAARTRGAHARGQGLEVPVRRLARAAPGRARPPRPAPRAACAQAAHSRRCALHLRAVRRRRARRPGRRTAARRVGAHALASFRPARHGRAQIGRERLAQPLAGPGQAAHDRARSRCSSASAISLYDSSSTTRRTNTARCSAERPSRARAELRARLRLQHAAPGGRRRVAGVSACAFGQRLPRGPRASGRGSRPGWRRSGRPRARTAARGRSGPRAWCARRKASWATSSATSWRRTMRRAAA